MQAVTTLRDAFEPHAPLIDSLSAGIVVLAGDDRVAFVNTAAESLFRTSRSKLLGRPLGALFDDTAALDELTVRCRTDQTTCVLREFAARPAARPEDTVILDVAATPLDDGRVVLETRDALRLSQIDKEAALLAQHDVGRAIVRQLAHEIKNPLGGLRGAAQLLAKRLTTPGLTEYTDVIIREADRLVALVDTMLGPSGPLRRESVNVHRLLDHVWRLLESEAPPNVRIERDYDPSLPQIDVDEDRIIQAFLNLGRNALQAVGDEGDIVLRTRAINGFVIGERSHVRVLRVDVEDSGPGVDEALRDKLFYPLVTGRAEGTGLGLAVAQDQINRHDGLIKLDNAERTIFSVYLPIDNGT